MLTTLQLAFAGYCASSLLLFALPRILHRKKHHSFPLFQDALFGSKILRIGHRGGCPTAIQNTMRAFEQSDSVSDMLQMDVCLTKDGILVVHHDQSLLRTCGIDRFISDFEFGQLPMIQNEVEAQFTQKTHKIKSKGEKIPSLEEVFIRFKGKPINIEIKTPSVPAISQLKRLIYKYDRLDNTIVGISGSSNKYLEIHFSDSKKFVNFLSIYKLLLLYITGLLPFISISQCVFQAPLYTKAYEQTKKRQTGNTWKNYIFFKLINISNFVSKPLVWHLRQRGIMTFYWVCNNQKEYQQAIDLGCSGIITDRVQQFSNFLKTKKD